MLWADEALSANFPPLKISRFLCKLCSSDLVHEIFIIAMGSLIMVAKAAVKNHHHSGSIRVMLVDFVIERVVQEKINARPVDSVDQLLSLRSFVAGI